MKKLAQRIETMEIETAFRMAFDSLGGLDAFKSWAHRNPRECRTFLSKLLPDSVFQLGEIQVIMASPEDERL